MRWRTHESLGLVTYSTIITLTYPTLDFLNSSLILVSALCPLISSTLPDKLDNNFNLEHRGFSHSLLCSIIITSIFSLPFIFLYFTLKDFNFSIPIVIPIFGFFWGYFIHLVADSFTDNGVHLFWPINKNKKRQPIYRLWYYSDGEESESKIVLVAYLITFITWVLYFIL